MTSVLSATISLLILANTNVALVVASEACDLISNSPSLSFVDSSEDSTSVILAVVGALL